jgi:hypothetical protein
MPIPVNCKSCGAKYNVPDQMAGRAAKCKCGQALPVPAQRSASGNAGVVAKLPAASLPLASFDELRAPPGVRKAVDRALHPGEKIVWMGRPAVSLWLRGGRVLMFVGVGLLLLGVPFLGFGGYCLTLPAETADLGSVLILLGLGGFMTLWGVCFSFKTWFMRRLAGYREFYVATNQRAFTLDYNALIRCRLTAYPAEQIASMIREDTDELLRGSGNLVFGYEVVHFRQNGATVNTLRIPRGFIKIENVAAVEALLRRTLKV